MRRDAVAEAAGTCPRPGLATPPESDPPLFLGRRHLAFSAHLPRRAAHACPLSLTAADTEEMS